MPAFVCEVAVAQMFTTPGGHHRRQKSVRNKQAGCSYIGDRDLWRHKCLDKPVKTIVCTSDVIIIEIASIAVTKLALIWRGRPTYMSADLHFTTDSFFLFCLLISELAEWNSTKTGHMVGSKCHRLNGLHCLLLTPKQSASVTVHLVHRRSLTTKVDCTAIC